MLHCQQVRPGTDGGGSAGESEVGGGVQGRQHARAAAVTAGNCSDAPPAGDAGNSRARGGRFKGDSRPERQHVAV
jgi:hypothetical protein